MTSKVKNDFSEAHFDTILCFLAIWASHMAEPHGLPIWQSHMALTRSPVIPAPGLHVPGPPCPMSLVPCPMSHDHDFVLKK